MTTAMPIVIRLIRQLKQTSGSRTNSNPCCQLVNQEVLFGRKSPPLRLCTTAFLALPVSYDREVCFATRFVLYQGLEKRSKRYQHRLFSRNEID
jgi:hypothetical protein